MLSLVTFLPLIGAAVLATRVQGERGRHTD